MVSGHWQPPLSRSSAKCCPVVAGSNPGGQDGVCHGRSLNLRSDSIRGWDVCRFSGDRRSRLTLWVGWIANRHSRRLLLIAAAVLMALTGACFAVITDFWPLLVIAFVGTMNPTSGDASIFVPLEQTVLTQTIAAPQPNRAVRALQRHRLMRDGAGRARGRASRFYNGVDRLYAGGRHAADVRPLWGAGAIGVTAVPAAVFRGRDG
jgi:hypothetical protein